MMADIESAAAILRGASRVVAFTGAGISTESGIPDFRSPGGVWTRYDPRDFTFDRFVASAENRRLYWQRSRESYAVIKQAQPNAAHRAIYDLDRAGKVLAVVTQNIDGLHARAGHSVDKVIELHGSGLFVSCLSCEKRWPREEIEIWLEKVAVPMCDACGGILKPTTVSFGQAMPPRPTAMAFRAASECDVLLTVGSSLVVYPAAALVPTAKEAGARLILINLEATEYDALADVAISGKAGEVLPEIVERCVRPAA
jgi:NAD-dependent deacetylase